MKTRIRKGRRWCGSGNDEGPQGLPQGMIAPETTKRLYRVAPLDGEICCDCLKPLGCVRRVSSDRVHHWHQDCNDLRCNNATTWQHGETGRLVTLRHDKTPGPRWYVVPDNKALTPNHPLRSDA